MPEKAKAWNDTLTSWLAPVLLTCAISLGTWLVVSINEQNVRLTQLLLEVQQVNERLGQYATKDELHELQRKFEVYVASEGKRD